MAREHNRAIHALTKSVKVRGFADLINQLRRAAASITANILEAYGEWQPGKRLTYLSVAKGSTWECWAHVDNMVDFELIDERATAEVRSLQHQITALLVTTIKNLEAEIGGPAQQ